MSLALTSIKLPRTATKLHVEIPALKRRFKHARRLVKAIPVDELFASIIENSPFAGHILARNWTRKEQVLRTVQPIDELEECDF
jgi:hypothetical protein